MGNTPKRKKALHGAPRRADARGPRASWPKYLVGGLVVVAFVLLVVFVSVDVSQNPQAIPEPPEGVETFEISEIGHTEQLVRYPADPPVGGIHSSTPLECRVYDQPVPNENAVHSLEHGAVWISYHPDLDDADVDALVGAASGRSEVIVAPYRDLDHPVVVTAWGTQLRLESADDPRIETFVRAFENQVAPEAGAAC